MFRMHVSLTGRDITADMLSYEKKTDHVETWFNSFTAFRSSSGERKALWGVLRRHVVRNAFFHWLSWDSRGLKARIKTPHFWPWKQTQPRSVQRAATFSAFQRHWKIITELWVRTNLIFYVFKLVFSLSCHIINGLLCGGIAEIFVDLSQKVPTTTWW